MLFSLEWLLELCPVEADRARIADALTSRGLTVDSIGGTGPATALDIDVAANRPDCLGHLGIARELAAATGVPLAGERPAAEAAGTAAGTRVAVKIENAELCPRFTAGLVHGVKIAPSPERVVRRLEACGQRSVNNVVDVSTLLMLELGQPVHFYDLARVASNAGRATLHVRNARSGETLRTLDGIDRKLDPEVLVIADAECALGLAGVIGGAGSEIHDGTRDVLVEAASFRTSTVRGTSRRLGIQTEASFRFARGVDPQAPPRAQALAARLLADLAGGRPAPGVVDVWPVPAAERPLELRASEIERLLGFRPTDEEIRAALGALSLSPEAGGDSTFRVRVPSYRIDLRVEADLVEEVARHVGYDRIPVRLGALPDERVEARPARADAAERARDLLAHLGFHEAMGYSMIAAGEDDGFVPADAAPPLVLSNPIAEPLAYLRRSVLPGLLRMMDLNIRRGSLDTRLFEAGRVFCGRDDEGLASERQRFGIVWSGTAEPRHWSRAPRELELYDLMGVVEHLLDGLDAAGDRRRVNGAHAAFHPGRSVHWETSEGRTLAWGGALRPDLAERFDHPVLAAEVELDAVPVRPRAAAQYHGLPRLPSVTRDLALVMTDALGYADVLRALASVDSPAPVEFWPVDRYEGPPLSAGEASLTVRFRLQPERKTLTDPETESYREALVRELDGLGVKIRGSAP